MIVVRVFGGLGNQMFQFAAARSLSLSRGVTLRVDAADFSVQRMHHGFELDRVFVASLQQASNDEMGRLLGWRRYGPLKRFFAHPRVRGVGARAVVVEPSFQFWPGLVDAPADCYLSGYWQSERYFAPHAAQLAQDFVFSASLDDANARVAGMMKQSEAVSLHVRRGDYVSNRRAFATHGVCAIDYYERAMRYLSERVERTRFFVFSDDMEWTKAHLPRGFDCHFVDHNQGGDSHVDMRLMSLCRHHVIANSSFSWWGAWLGCNPHKLVVAPKRWFVVDKDDSDLLPRSWVRL